MNNDFCFTSTELSLKHRIVAFHNYLFCSVLIVCDSHRMQAGLQASSLSPPAQLPSQESFSKSETNTFPSSPGWNLRTRRALLRLSIVAQPGGGGTEVPADTSDRWPCPPRATTSPAPSSNSPRLLQATPPSLAGGPALFPFLASHGHLFCQTPRSPSFFILPLIP